MGAFVIASNTDITPRRDPPLEQIVADYDRNQGGQRISTPAAHPRSRKLTRARTRFFALLRCP
jgi:hypothetical protein